MSNRVTIKLTANFERNLADIEQFLIEAEAPQAFDGLLDELLGRVLPNLERFPKLGRPFFNRAIGSAEAVNATAELKAKLATLVGTSLTSLREYVMNHYLVLYVQVDDTLFLLSIKHHKQLSFDFEGHWGSSACQTQAVFRCVACGHQAHADVVGAINILARGHRAAACGEVVSRARPETERSKAKRAASAKQEPTEATTAGSACCGAVGIPRL